MINIDNPTYRQGYVIELLGILLFFGITLFLRHKLNKSKKQIKNLKNKRNVYQKNNIMLIMFVICTILLFNKKIYAIMAMTYYFVDIITVLLNFIIIFIINLLIEICIIHKNKFNKQNLIEIFSVSVIENIIFNVTLIAMILFNDVLSNSYMTINIIISTTITGLYKAFYLNLRNISSLKKILILVIFFVLLLFSAYVTGGNIRMSLNSIGFCIYIKRAIEGYTNGKDIFYDNISILINSLGF